jgi:hypothetical protein
MMQQKVIVTQVRITKLGQVKHFQIKIPKGAKRIIGIETGFRLSKATPIGIFVPDDSGGSGSGGSGAVGP